MGRLIQRGAVRLRQSSPNGPQGLGVRRSGLLDVPQAAIHGQVHLVARRARAGPHAAGLRAAGAAHGGQPHTGTRRAGVAFVSRGGLSFSSPRSSRTTGELLAEVPRQPPHRGVDHLLSALLKRVQIVERVDIAQPAGLDQTHVDVADLRAAHRFVEQ